MAVVPARLEMKFHHWPRLGVFVVCDRIDIYCLPVVATPSSASAVSGRVSKVQDSYFHPVQCVSAAAVFDQNIIRSRTAASSQAPGSRPA